MNEPEKFIRVAIASDLHFIDASKNKEASHSNLALTRVDGEAPLLWQRLCEKITTCGITADLLVTPGDITTYADRVGLNYAWVKLQELGGLLNVNVVAAATGNHDVQTRSIEMGNVIRDLNVATDLTEHLRQLTPPYPIVVLGTSLTPLEEDGHDRRVKYFGADYVIFDEHQDYRLVVFNSCGRHTTDKKEYERGRIAKSSLDWLEHELEKVYDKKNKKIGIFVCHHHPIVHEDHSLGSYDQMQNGTELISLLSKYGDWVIIHGHKHHAKITYAQGGAKKLTVFAAGTLSAQNGVGDDGLSNQFYVMELGLTKAGLRGKIETWKWTGSVWEETRSRKDGVYTGVGFGQTKSLFELAEEIDGNLNPLVEVKWDSLIKIIPNLNYLLPSDFCHLEEELQDFGVDVSWSDRGEIETVVKGGVSQ